MAQSIYEDQQLHAEPCVRRCPPGPVHAKGRMARRLITSKRNYIGNAIPLGQYTPMKYGQIIIFQIYTYNFIYNLYILVHLDRIALKIMMNHFVRSLQMK